ncbi:MAG: pyruvate dehydrogenase complex E1 component subunit beta [Bacteroidetes bacterium]|nr:pyruvate dehydrogenase complex E1 component subunit beta [Bacteroidota bacterium]MCL5737642.1 pyruvate dehydrogenase complex E1 component subunit beta [Bacteroidota bacterium]
MPEITYREALNQALAEEMERDDSVFIVGEEVAQYQGAYKVTQGLLQKFGPERVIDAPISESGFTGLGVGAAMVGLRPIVEVMTFNFSLVAFDQIINNAAKMRHMSGGQLKVPMVIRGPNGSAHQLAATHSQSLESFYSHVPGLKVVMPGTPKDAKGLLKSAIRDDNPVIFMESEVIYGMKGEVPEGEYTIPIGKTDVKRQGKDVTIVAYARMLGVALNAAEILAKDGIQAEIVDPMTIRPLDDEPILESVKKTNRCVVITEAWPFAGVGSEIAFRVSSKAFDYLDAPVELVSSEDVPMPYSKTLEHNVLPTPEKIVNAAMRVLYNSKDPGKSED